jgi:hypothetical protein
MVDLKDLRPAFLRLLPAFRRVVDELPSRRQALQQAVRTAAKKYGPSLGELYFSRELAMDQFIQNVIALIVWLLLVVLTLL